MSPGKRRRIETSAKEKSGTMTYDEYITLVGEDEGLYCESDPSSDLSESVSSKSLRSKNTGFWEYTHNDGLTVVVPPKHGTPLPSVIFNEGGTTFVLWTYSNQIAWNSYMQCIDNRICNDYIYNNPYMTHFEAKSSAIMLILEMVSKNFNFEEITENVKKRCAKQISDGVFFSRVDELQERLLPNFLSISLLLFYHSSHIRYIAVHSILTKFYNAVQEFVKFRFNNCFYIKNIKCPEHVDWKSTDDNDLIIYNYMGDVLDLFEKVTKNTGPYPEVAILKKYLLEKPKDTGLADCWILMDDITKFEQKIRAKLDPLLYAEMDFIRRHYKNVSKHGVFQADRVDSLFTLRAECVANLKKLKSMTDWWSSLSEKLLKPFYK
eukprot:GHVL01005373.1.p1 GENE.GHVL01005373.1~~GHVL01005373.1.p1  ORF type:complete len:378 (+),score=73.85 GHVL01005373.1:673-1806(+)